jgi:hypothetical protein
MFFQCTGTVMEETERRRVQRVRLMQPLRGMAGSQRVFVLDLSVHGIRIAHQEELGRAGEACLLTFEWEGIHISVHCRISHTQVLRAGSPSRSRTLMHSGLEIEGASNEARTTLRTMIEAHVLRAIDEQKANARGVPAIAAQSFQTGKGDQFVQHLFTNGRWSQRETTDSRQPPAGFTISKEQTRAEVQMLRDAYEAGDATTRDLIRKMSELSISRIEGIPTRRYEP